MGLTAEARQSHNQLVGGTGIRVTKYPANAAGAVLTSDGAGATGKWAFKAAGANVAIIVAAGVIANGTPFRLVWLGLDTPLHVAVYVVRLGIATGAAAAMAPVLGEYFADLLVAGSKTDNTIPFCATTLAAATVNICGDLAASTAANETINASIGVMTGMGT